MRETSSLSMNAILPTVQWARERSTPALEQAGGEAKGRLNRDSSKSVLSESWFPSAKCFWRGFDVLFPPEVMLQRRVQSEVRITLTATSGILQADPLSHVIAGVGRSRSIWFHEGMSMWRPTVSTVARDAQQTI